MSAPALLLACPMLAGVAAAVVFGSGPPETIAVVALGWLAAAAAFWSGRRSIFPAAVAAGSFAVGAALGGQAERASRNAPILAWFREYARDAPAAIAGVLREDAARTANGVSIVVDVSAIDGRRVSGGVRVSIAGDMAAAAASDWQAGREVSIAASLREPLDYRDPGVASDRLRLARQGIVLLGSAKSAALVTLRARGSVLSEAAGALRVWVRRATAASVGRWSPKSAGVVTAILIGDRGGLDPDDERRLQDAGTYHVIAISGGNIALLTAMLVALGRAVRLPPRATAAASMALVAFYGYAAGLAPSVLRATVGGTVYLGARTVDHRGTPLNALAVAAVFAAATAPLTLMDPGFVLSFGATVAIVAGASRLAPSPTRDRRAGAGRRACRTLLLGARTLCAATICAEIALAPVSARFFGRVSAAGLVLNFAAIPLMSVIQIAGLLAVAVAAVSTAAAAAAGWVAHVATLALLGSASLVDAAPWLVLDVPPPALWLVALWYLGWLVILLGRGRSARAPATAVVCVTAAIMLLSPGLARGHLAPAPAEGWTRVVVLDVGQGDATLLWPADARPMLVDAGGIPGSAFDLGRRVTLPAAWAFGVRSLEALALTHGDPDHIGGAPAIVRALRPAAIWAGIPVPRSEPLRRLREAADRAGIPWAERRTGQSLMLGPAKITVLNPPDPEWERQKVRNDDSIVLEVRIGDVAFVLPGDITKAVEPAVAARFEPAQVVIVKAPHHGSPGSSSPPFLAATHPAAVIFSAGRHNPFGHPAPAIVDRYRAAGAHVFSTADDGAVVVDTNGQHVRVWTWGSRRDLWLR